VLWRNLVNRLLLALLAMAMAGALAACGGGPSPSPEQGATASPVTIATESATATEDASPRATDDDDDDDGSDDSGEPNELAEVLPQEVGGIALTYQFDDGDDLLEGEGSPEADDLLDRVGADSDDVSSAFGFGADQENGAVISILAFRVPGADEDRLRDEFLRTIEEEAEAEQTATEGTVGGKDVVILEREDQVGTGYLYTRGDIVFVVGATSEDLAEEALSQLP
jgi:hypothetical protein